MTVTVRAGELRQHVIFWRKISGSSESGAEVTNDFPINNWHALSNPSWGKFLVPRGTEATTASGAMIAAQSFDLYIRYRNDLQTNDRAVCEGRTYNILSVADLDSSRQMTKIQVVAVGVGDHS